MPTLEELRIKQAMQQAQAENALAAAEAEQAKADVAQQAVQQVSSTNTPAPETTVTVETPAADNTPAPSATPTSSDQLKTAQDNYNQLNADALKQTQEINAANTKMWSDLINEQYERKRQKEQEMKAQEKANTLSSMATGTTELAAGIINLLSVGQLHASNQQYKSYSQDWMKKAEQDLKEHRARRDNLQATLDRLKLQQQQVANAGRLQDMQMKQQQAREALNIAIQNNQLEYQRQKDAAEQARKDRKEEADAALNDAKIKNINADTYATGQGIKIKQAEQKSKEQIERLKLGYVPDENDPTGYRYDPDTAERMKAQLSRSSSSSSSSSGGKQTGDRYAVVIDGQNEVLTMSKETYAQGIKSGTEEIKRDLAENAEKTLRSAGIPVDSELTFEQLVELSHQKKVVDGNGNRVANPLYGRDLEIIQALRNTGENKEDYEVIERFVKDNKSRVNRFNKHLKDLSTGDAEEAGNDDYSQYIVG